MYLEPFHKFFPDVAQAEVRTIYVTEGPELPAGAYMLVEAYCTDPDCDCERVMLNVFEKDLGHVATISYGFNPAKTRAWYDGPNPFLDPLNPQSAHSEMILELVKDMALDEEYKERLKRHYRMVKAAVSAGGSHASDRNPHDNLREPRPTGRPANRAKALRKLQKTARRKNRKR